MLRQLLVDFAAVGVYTIGYGLALNISNLLNYALYNAYTQVSVREYETKGPAAVVRTKRAVLHGLVYFCTAMIVGLVVVGRDALLLMAGNDKTASAPIFVLIGIVYTLDGMFGICGAGLLLLKRSRTVLLLTLGAAVLNVILNSQLIPRFGVMGSAYSSILSFTALNIARYLTCPRELRALPDARATIIAIGLGVLCVAIANFTQLGGVESHAGRIVLLALLLLIGFVAPAFMLDGELRSAVLHHLNSVRQRTHPTR
jgi:O-antigen/teichoic acid export membrane protein